MTSVPYRNSRVLSESENCMIHWHVVVFIALIERFIVILKRSFSVKIMYVIDKYKPFAFSLKSECYSLFKHLIYDSICLNRSSPLSHAGSELVIFPSKFPQC